MTALNTRLWSMFHTKEMSPILITTSAGNARGGEGKTFSTLLILSFTLATSTLVLRGTLVLVRRILNNGTLEVKQSTKKEGWAKFVLHVPCWDDNFFPSTLILGEKYVLRFYESTLRSLISVTTCSVVLSSRLRTSACLLHRNKSVIKEIIIWW